MAFIVKVVAHIRVVDILLNLKSQAFNTENIALAYSDYFVTLVSALQYYFVDSLADFKAFVGFSHKVT